MATLVLPFPTFTPGTPAYANQIQDNYVAIRDHINGQNIGTGNLEATLVSRVGGPILFLNQQSQEQIALSIVNSRSKSAIKIQQTALLSAGNSIIHIKDDAAHVAAGDAQVFLELLVGSTIPALLVKHGAVETFKLRRTQLDLFGTAIQATATTLNLFNNAVQANSTGLISATNATISNDINVTGDVISQNTYHLGPKLINAGDRSGSYDIDLSTGTIHRINLVAAGTLNLTLSNPSVGGAYVLEIVHGIAASTVAFPASVKWGGGAVPAFSTQINKIDLISLIYNGTVYYANAALGY